MNSQTQGVNYKNKEGEHCGVSFSDAPLQKFHPISGNPVILDCTTRPLS